MYISLFLKETCTSGESYSLPTWRHRMPSASSTESEFAAVPLSPGKCPGRCLCGKAGRAHSSFGWLFSRRLEYIPTCRTRLGSTTKAFSPLSRSSE